MSDVEGNEDGERKDFVVIFDENGVINVSYKAVKYDRIIKDSVIRTPLTLI